MPLAMIENAVITFISMSLLSIVLFLLCPFKQKFRQMAIAEIVSVFVPLGLLHIGRQIHLPAAIGTYFVCFVSAFIWGFYLLRGFGNKMLAVSLPVLGLLICYFGELVNYNLILLFTEMDITGTYGSFVGTILMLSGTLAVSTGVALAVGFGLRRIGAGNMHLSKRNTAILTALIAATLCADYLAPAAIQSATQLAIKPLVSVLNVTLLPLTFIVILLYLFLLIILNKELLAQRKEQELLLRERMYENMGAYNASLEKLYMEMKAHRHDSRNMLAAMSSFIDGKDWNGLNAYFYDHMLPAGETLNSGLFKIGRLQYLRIGELKGVIAMKAIATKDNGVDLQIDVAEPIDHIEMDILDLCRVVGIFLDNAIEEASLSEGREVKCGIIRLEHSTQIVIANSLHAPPNLRRLFAKGYTTKGEGRGQGLYTVKSILEKYPNTTLDTKIDGDELIMLLNIESSTESKVSIVKQGGERLDSHIHL